MRHLRRILALPAAVAVALTDRRAVIEADLARWAKLEARETRYPGLLLDLLSERPEFRTLLDHRLSQGNAPGRVLGKLTFILLRKRTLLFLATDDIGPGLYIQHGFGTGVFAKEIGPNVWINQNVTVGATPTGAGEVGVPTIEEGVTIYTGAVIVGPVRIGRNAVVGANAVVTKDVPDDMVAVGVPAQVRPKGRVTQS